MKPLIFLIETQKKKIAQEEESSKVSEDRILLLSNEKKKQKVQLWEERSKNGDFSGCGHKLGLVSEGSVEVFIVLNDDKISGDNKEKKGRGDEWTGEAKEHPDSVKDKNPNIACS